jgi:hypothetical protein
MSNDFYGDWSNIIKNSRLNHVFVHYNSPCLQCNKLEEQMVKVGVVVICQDCCKELFKTDKPLDEPIYKELLKKWRKQDED